MVTMLQGIKVTLQGMVLNAARTGLQDLFLAQKSARYCQTGYGDDQFSAAPAVGEGQF
jgi:hypothetical protein